MSKVHRRQRSRSIQQSRPSPCPCSKLAANSCYENFALERELSKRLNAFGNCDLSKMGAKFVKQKSV
jgi:hypothetical protein